VLVIVEQVALRGLLPQRTSLYASGFPAFAEAASRRQVAACGLAGRAFLNILLSSCCLLGSSGAIWTFENFEFFNSLLGFQEEKGNPD